MPQAELDDATMELARGEAERRGISVSSMIGAALQFAADESRHIANDAAGPGAPAPSPEFVATALVNGRALIEERGISVPRTTE